MTVSGRNIVVHGKIVRIARLDGEKYKFLDNPQSVVAGLRAHADRVDLFTFLDKLPATSPCHPYPREWDNLATLPLTTFDAWWKTQIDNKTRNMVRRAEKRGVQTREVPFDDALVHGIYEIYNECPIRQGTPFAHYGKGQEWVRSHAGTFLDSSVFLGAFFEEKMIGFIKLTADDTRTQAGIMHIVSMVGHREKAPTNALIAQAVRSCADRGIPFLVYSNFSYGNKQRDSLSDFKKNNGFEKVDVPRYYVPLTRLGWLTFRLGLHHRLADRIPEPVLVTLRGLRRTWYSRKFHPVTES